MLPGHISGIYSREEMFIDLRQLCDFSGARFIHAQAYGIDLKRKQVLIGFNGSTLPADVISINIGSTSCIAGTAGAAEWAIPTKPVPDLLRGWALVQAAAAQARMRIVVVGGGAGGVELALAMHSQMRNEAEFTIIRAGPRLLPGYHSRARYC